MAYKIFWIGALFISSVFSAPAKQEAASAPQSTFFKSQLAKGKSGDFIVTSQFDLYTVLLLRFISDKTAIIEEISIPETNLSSLTKNPETFGWKKWVENKAPGNTSWTSYELDLHTNRLKSCFSYTLRAYLPNEDSSYFLSKLLALPLKKTPPDKRKKIGPPPKDNEPDHRKLWLPTVFIEGKKVATPVITPYTGKWPADDSPLAGCEIEVYFGDFPLPYWIEVKSPHYKASVRTLNSGHLLHSPLTLP